MTNPDSILKSRDITLPAKFRLVKAMVFLVVMYGCDYKKSWALKNWCFWTVVWCWKTLESPLDSKEIQLVHPKGNQSWIFIGRTDAEAETPILWPSDVKNRLIWKDPDAGDDWRQKEKGTTDDEMVESHHQLNGHEKGCPQRDHFTWNRPKQPQSGLAQRHICRVTLPDQQLLSFWFVGEQVSEKRYSPTKT